MQRAGSRCTLAVQSGTPGARLEAEQQRLAALRQRAGWLLEGREAALVLREAAPREVDAWAGTPHAAAAKQRS